MSTKKYTPESEKIEVLQSEEVGPESWAEQSGGQTVDSYYIGDYFDETVHFGLQGQVAQGPKRRKKQGTISRNKPVYYDPPDKEGFWTKYGVCQGIRSVNTRLLISAAECEQEIADARKRILANIALIHSITG